MDSVSPPFYLPNGDGEQVPDRWHHGVVVEKTGEDNDASKKLRTMHLYSRSVNILYGRIPCSGDWRQYRLGSWMKFTMRGDQYFATDPIHPDHPPYPTRLSPVNQTVVQVKVRFFLVPDSIKHTKMSRDRRKYYKMWSPEMGGVYVDGDTINMFGMEGGKMYSGWVQSSLDLNFAPNDVDEDGWPYDRSLYWQLVYEQSGGQNKLEKESQEDYEKEVEKLLKESRRQAMAIYLAKKDKPMLDKLAEEFSRTDYNSMLLSETERIGMPRIQIEPQRLQPCFIDRKPTGDDFGMISVGGGFKKITPNDVCGSMEMSQRVNNPLIQSGGSSLMGGFGFSSATKISPAKQQDNMAFGFRGKVSVSPQPPAAQNNPVVFGGQGFSYNQPAVQFGRPNGDAFSNNGPVMSHEIRNTGGQGFAFRNAQPASQQNLSARSHSPWSSEGEDAKRLTSPSPQANVNISQSKPSGGGFGFNAGGLQSGQGYSSAPRPQPSLQAGNQPNGFGNANVQLTNAFPSADKKPSSNRGGFGFGIKNQAVNGNGSSPTASRPLAPQNAGGNFGNLAANNNMPNVTQAFQGMNVSASSGPRTVHGKQFGGFTKNTKF